MQNTTFAERHTTKIQASRPLTGWLLILGDSLLSASIASAAVGSSLGTVFTSRRSNSAHPIDFSNEAWLNERSWDPYLRSIGGDLPCLAIVNTVSSPEQISVNALSVQAMTAAKQALQRSGHDPVTIHVGSVESDDEEVGPFRHVLGRRIAESQEIDFLMQLPLLRNDHDKESIAQWRRVQRLLTHLPALANEVTIDIATVGDVAKSVIALAQQDVEQSQQILLHSLRTQTLAGLLRPGVSRAHLARRLERQVWKAMSSTARTASDDLLCRFGAWADVALGGPNHFLDARVVGLTERTIDIRE